MKWKKWLENWEMTSLKISAGFLDMEWKPQDEDKAAAWALYIELLTRITTQPLAEQDGDEKTALTSVYNLFPLTREIIKANGRHCLEFTKIAVVVLNQIIRPFTARWHRKSLAGAFSGAMPAIPHGTGRLAGEAAQLHEDARRHGRGRRFDCVGN